MGNEMDYNQAYNTLKQVVVDNSFSLSQVQATTKEQIAVMLGVNITDTFWSGGNEGFYINLKRNIEIEMQDGLEQSDLGFLREQIEGGARTAMRTRFPDFEIRHRKSGGYRVLEIHLDGISKEEV